MCFETARFDLLKFERMVDPHVRPGRDVTVWLRDHLHAQHFDVGEPRLAYKSWVIDVARDGRHYLIGACLVMEGPVFPIVNWGRWRLVFERRRTLADRLLMRNDLAPDDELVRRVAPLLNRQFEKVREWRRLTPP